MFSTVVFSSILLCFIAMVSAGQQSIGVKGTFMCGSKPENGSKVKLFDKDIIGPDDLLDEGYTEANGSFKLQGTTKEFTKIDPVFKVYTDCNDGKMPCQRRIRWEIPNEYISKGSTPRKYYDLGTINLEAKFSGEDRDCFH